MRHMPFALLLFALLAGCAGNIADHIGPKSSIVSPQLIRYGLDIPQTRCVGERLGNSLSPVQLRRLVRAAGAVTGGYYEPGKLTLRDLDYVASSLNDAAVPRALAEAGQGCGVSPESIAAREAAAPEGAPEAASPVPAPASETGAASPPVAAAPVPTRAAWLNLGAATTGQAIAVDASTIEQAAATRTAWFRMTDPGAAKPSDVSYRLRIDCTAKTINATAHRKLDAAGAVAEFRESADTPLAVEGGTVMEIAWLALCT